MTFCSLLESFACSELISICDNATIIQQAFFASRSGCFYRTKRGNAGSFRLAVELSALHPSTIVYFVEDDHLHRPLQKQFICEGLKWFDFVSLYDHPDKYSNSLYPGLKRRLIATPLGHFADAPSTVMTFACRIETLRKAESILMLPQFTDTALKAPLDHELFLALSREGFTLGSSIPGQSTHCEKRWLSPGFNWQEYAESIASKYHLRANQ